jgi:catecholate siderophore receptor
MDEHEVDLTLGNHATAGHGRLQPASTGENAALRLNAMATKADNNGAGSSIDKSGMAAACAGASARATSSRSAGTTWTTTTA